MPRIKQAVIGDLHLGVLHRLIPNHLALQIHTLHFIMKRVVDEGIQQVVLLGDNFDSPVVAIEIVKALLAFVNTYPDVTFRWIVGNHDRVSLDGESYVDLISYITETGGCSNLNMVLEPERDGVVCYMPYPHNKALPKTKIAFGHCDAPNAVRDNGSPIHTDVEWDKKIIWVIGHNHTKQRPSKRIWYPGTPWQVSFGEKPDKEWAIVEYETDPAKPLAFKYTGIPIPLPYTLLNVTIDKISDLKKLKPAPFYYKLKIEDGVVLPKDFLATHSNCQLRNRVMQRIEVQASDEETADDAPAITLDYKLEDFLVSKGLNEKQARLGLKMVQPLIRKLHLA